MFSQTPLSLIHLTLKFLQLLHRKLRVTPFNQPQGPVTNIERLLSQVHWNHSFIIVNSSPSFQSSLPLSFQGTPPIISLKSNSLTPDPDQPCHHCIGKQPDTAQIYPTLPLKLDPKFVVPPLALFGDHNNGDQLHNWAKQKINKSYKISSVQNTEHTTYSNKLKSHFL